MVVFDFAQLNVSDEGGGLGFGLGWLDVQVLDKAIQELEESHHLQSAIMSSSRSATLHVFRAFADAQLVISSAV